MTFASVCNVTAWLLCGVLGFLLLTDFVKTELWIAKEQKGQVNINKPKE